MTRYSKLDVSMLEIEKSVDLTDGLGLGDPA